MSLVENIKKEIMAIEGRIKKTERDIVKNEAISLYLKNKLAQIVASK